MRFFDSLASIFTQKTHFFYTNVCINEKKAVPLQHKTKTGEMVTINEMQFAGIIGMGVLALTQVVLVPRRVAKHPVYGWARWLMATGLALLSLQFVVQYAFNIRQDMGTTQAVFVNLIFFVPCTLCMSLGILYVQRQGQVTRGEWMTGWRLYGLILAILVGTALADGVPFREESHALRIAEYVCSVIYLVQQGYYFYLHLHAYHRMQRAVEEYYDRERNDLLRWMGFSIIVLASFALIVPIIMFAPDFILIPFAILSFFMIYYTASSFYAYGISLDTQRVEEAENSLQTDAEEEEQEAGTGLSEGEKRRIEKASREWVEAGGYLKPNLTLTSVADEMHLQRYLLKAWLRKTEYGKLSSWINYLRTEEAKRLMAEHPEWSLDIVSEHCGFSSRQYFHKIFHEQMGITPTSFQERI